VDLLKTLNEYKSVLSKVEGEVERIRVGSVSKSKLNTDNTVFSRKNAQKTQIPSK
jgi:hypothetical protein